MRWITLSSARRASSKRTVAFSVARFTLASTPSRRFRFFSMRAAQRKEILILVLVVEHAGGVEVAQHVVRARARFGVATLGLQARHEALEQREALLDALVAGSKLLERLFERGSGVIRHRLLPL